MASPKDKTLRTAQLAKAQPGERGVRHEDVFCGLRSGSVFEGTQLDYVGHLEARIILKHFDKERQCLAGYFEIKRHRKDRPILTTFFDGEVIGDRHKFETGRWGSTVSQDKKGWEMFAEFEEHRELLARPEKTFNPFQRENVFMRWKEHYTAPDCHLKVPGVSIDGFYYLVYDLSARKITGMYNSPQTTRMQRP
ncbi:MAG: cytoplasmic vesicle protein, Vid24 family [Amphiamblys sp. WSBS2006]|nr:MAG: cytoplasmic vesicle protein, Vid24 family [Amphiamblys sp. WSBS2006]